MPPKRAAAKTESPSRRKVGRPKKMETEDPAEAEPGEEEPVEEPEEVLENPSPSLKRRGRPKKSKQPVAAEMEEEDGVTTITLNIDDLIDIPAPSSANKKRKAPTKSPAAKKGKSDTSVKDHGGAGDGENLIQCTLCDARVVQLVRHIRAQHGDDPDYDSKIKEARAMEAKVQSSTPRKSTNNLLDDLTITVSKMSKEPLVDRRTITGERGNSLVRPKNTQCPICEKVVRRYDLNKHIRNVHSGEKPNKCPYCEYASPWKGNLNTHIAGVHTKARLHDCIRCGLSFKTRSAMIGHVRKVHDKMYQPKERLFECEECNKKFYKKFHLQRHIRVHTGEKPFVCAFCEKMFASKTNMDSHIQSVHLKIKPFKCGYCEKGFARKKMMLLHIRKHHMAKDNNTIGLPNMIDVDDVTMDDNMDNESNASIESGEILGGGDSGMVLIKMRDDNGTEPDEAVKQYMFVPADELPSDLDNTLDNTLNTTMADRSTDKLNQSLDTSHVMDGASNELSASGSAVGAEVAGDGGSSQPVVINVGAGQVVQALQTTQGIMLVTQSATITDTVDKTSATVVPTASGGAAPSPSKTVVAEQAEAKQSVNQQGEDIGAEMVEAHVRSTEGEPDLVQQALDETAPEVTDAAASAVEGDSPSKSAVISTDTDLTGGLPANLLASEEADHNDTTNGEVETYFIEDIQTNTDN